MKTLSVVGVGPGSPDLITLRGLRRIQEADVLFFPVKEKNAKSRALETVKQYLKSDTKKVPLVFPMTKDEGVLKKAWREAADRILETSFEKAVFVTIGDVSFYCTFFYLLPYLAGRIVLELVPGVPSFSACAASIGIPLALGSESVLIASGTNELRKEPAETVVVMKPPSFSEDLKKLEAELKSRGYNQIYYAAFCQTKEERILRRVPEKAEYLSMIIAKK